MFNRIKSRLKREQFLTTPLAILTRPTYIIRRGLYQSILRTAPTITGDILDFGCGSKPYESLFVNARSYLGLDVKVSGHSHSDSKVDVFYDGSRLPFADHSFDAVVSFEVFEHIFNVEDILMEIRRVLKPGGKLVVTIPFAWEEHEVPYDFARYTSFGIRHMLQRRGFEILELQKTTTYVRAICQMWIAYLAQYLGPKKGLPSRVFQVLVLFPMNVFALFLDSILPKRFEYYCNCIIVAAKGPEAATLGPGS